MEEKLSVRGEKNRRAETCENAKNRGADNENKKKRVLYEVRKTGVDERGPRNESHYRVVSEFG